MSLKENNFSDLKFVSTSQVFLPIRDNQVNAIILLSVVEADFLTNVSSSCQ